MGVSEHGQQLTTLTERERTFLDSLPAGERPAALAGLRALAQRRANDAAERRVLGLARKKEEGRKGSTKVVAESATTLVGDLPKNRRETPQLELWGWVREVRFYYAASATPPTCAAC